MFATVLARLFHLLGGPFVQAAVKAYRANLAAENASEKIAADLAARELSVEQRERELATQVVIGAGPLVYRAAAPAVRLRHLRVEGGGVGQGAGPRHDRCVVDRDVAMGDDHSRRLFRRAESEERARILGRKCGQAWRLAWQ